MATASGGGTFIGTKHDLWKLMANPVATAKSSSTSRRQPAALVEALQRIRVSSAYCKIGQGMSEARGWDREPRPHAWWIRRWSTSATRMNI
jgi:hypothetical protein